MANVSAVSLSFLRWKVTKCHYLPSKCVFFIRLVLEVSWISLHLILCLEAKAFAGSAFMNRESQRTWERTRRQQQRSGSRSCTISTSPTAWPLPTSHLPLHTLSSTCHQPRCAIDPSAKVCPLLSLYLVPSPSDAWWESGFNRIHPGRPFCTWYTILPPLWIFGIVLKTYFASKSVHLSLLFLWLSAVQHASTVGVMRKGDVTFFITVRATGLSANNL